MAHWQAATHLATVPGLFRPRLCDQVLQVVDLLGQRLDLIAEGPTHDLGPLEDPLAAALDRLRRAGHLVEATAPAIDPTRVSIGAAMLPEWRCVFVACRGAFRASSRTLEEWTWATVAEAKTRAKEKNRNRLS